MAASRWHQDPEVTQLIEYFNREDKFEQPDRLTPSEIRTILKEFERCRKDFVYAARNYFWITNKKLGDQLFTLWPSQELILEKVLEIKARNLPQKLIIIKARQLGCSTLIEAMVAWRTMFFANVNALVVSYDRSHTADVLFPIMCFIYDRMPWWLRPMCAQRKSDEILYFDNPKPEMRMIEPGLNSRVYVKGANSTTGVGQGIRLSCAHISEFSDYDERLAKGIIDEDMVNALVEDGNTFAILESTAKGANTYSHRLWKRCMELVGKDEAEWYPLFLPWFFEATRVRPVRVDFHVERPEHQMRERVNSEWTLCDNLDCGQFHYRYMAKRDRDGDLCPTCEKGTLHAYTLTDEQLAWYQNRRKNADRDEDSTKKLKQEIACVTGESRISTERGIIRIDQAEGSRFTETGKVSKWYDHGPRETLLVKTRMGRELTCTPEHKFFLPSGECVEAEKLEPGQVIALSPPNFCESQCTAKWRFTPGVEIAIDMNEDWGRLLGYFMGDGSWDRSGLMFAVDGNDWDVASDIANLCTRIIGTPSRITERGPHEWIIASSNIKWFEIMKGLRCIEAYESRGYHRVVHVPEFIWRSSRPVVKQFLSALVECDGHAYKASPKTVFFTCHEQFARDIQLLLLGFRINATIYHEDKINAEGYRYIGRNVAMRAEASNAFHREIGFISKRKSGTACVRPAQRSFAFKNQMEDEIASVVPAGEQKVYDLTIHATHRFGANGMLVHNTTAEESFQVTGYQMFGQKAQDFANAQVRPPIAEGDFAPDGKFHGCNTRLGRKPDGKYPCFQEDCPEDHEWDDAPMKVWEWPRVGAEYCVGADVSEGLGGKSAFSVGVCTRISTMGGADYQVATWRSNTMDPIGFAYKLNHLGLYFNCALMSVECNRYDICLGTMRFQLGYPNCYRWKHLDSMKIMSNKLGWWTNLSSRPRLWQTFKRWLQQELYYVRSHNLAEEMKNFVKDDEDDYSAGGDKEEHDDELIAGMISLYTAHEGDWNDALGMISAKQELTKEEAQYHLFCCNCNNLWWQNSVEETSVDPTQFTPSLGVNKEVTSSGGLRCPACGGRRIEITRNRDGAGTLMETADPDALYREAAQDYWDPSQAWDAAQLNHDYDLPT